MNMLAAIAGMLGTTAADWNGIVHNALPPGQARHQAPPRPRFGSVKIHQRHAAKTRRKKRAKKLGHA